MKKQLEENEKAMKAMQQSYEEKLAAAKASVRAASKLNLTQKVFLNCDVLAL